MSRKRRKKMKLLEGENLINKKLNKEFPSRRARKGLLHRIKSLRDTESSPTSRRM
jgi:hypothetical protein